MKTQNRFLVLLLLFYISIYSLIAIPAKSRSVFQLRPDDPEAFYFTAEKYNIIPDGKTDISDALQAAINQLKTEKSFGILFIPEGK